MAVLCPRLPSAPCWCPCASSLPVAASVMPTRVCPPVSPQRLQRCKSFCTSLFKLSSPLEQLSSRLHQSPPAAPAARPQPSVLSVPCGAGWRPVARADVRRGHQREQSGRGWADAVGGKGRLIFLYPCAPESSAFF